MGVRINAFNGLLKVNGLLLIPETFCTVVIIAALASALKGWLVPCKSDKNLSSAIEVILKIEET